MPCSIIVPNVRDPSLFLQPVSLLVSALTTLSSRVNTVASVLRFVWTSSHGCDTGKWRIHAQKSWIGTFDIIQFYLRWWIKGVTWIMRMHTNAYILPRLKPFFQQIAQRSLWHHSPDNWLPRGLVPSKHIQTFLVKYVYTNTHNWYPNSTPKTRPLGSTNAEHNGSDAFDIFKSKITSTSMCCKHRRRHQSNAKIATSTVAFKQMQIRARAPWPERQDFPAWNVSNVPRVTRQEGPFEGS